MQADLAVGQPVRLERRPGTVVGRLTASRAVRSGSLWGLIFGVAIASSQISYTTIYKTQAERDALAAAYGSNKATSALFGPAPQLQTVAGFTVFKISMTLMILGAVWGLLLSTKLLRGEEDDGRWDLLLSGQTTRSGAADAGARRSGRRSLDAVGGHRCHHSALRPEFERGHRSRPLPLLRPGHGGNCVHVPGRRRAHQPAGCDTPPGRLVRRSLPRGGLRRSDDRRCGCRIVLADLDEPTGLGGGAATPHCAPTARARTDHRVHRDPRGRRRAARRDPRRGREHRAGPVTLRAAPPTALRTDGSRHPLDEGHASSDGALRSPSPGCSSV